ncbi:hypothetical protein AM629_06300 [Photorhabdus heterorhabditis]|uniref:DUF4165 domain-containing protein n=1 Tax=Photorhabdus heterorhabditis TaxID=880156 RepID=A0ABR5KDX9_9GAMM|nr:Ig-like domain-containing protein [Photorhabdus heterorhabditis]KOY62823.1 hypothetical protein AM629_06300 [Photorhabdus heterorhabditis]
MRLKYIAGMVGIVIELTSLPASALVYNFSFQDTNNTVVSVRPVTQTLLNPSGNITLNLISGLDRYEKITVTRDSDQAQMYSGYTTLVGVADRVIAQNGTEYYGKDMTLPALGEGSYTLVNETLDLKQAVVSSNTYQFTVDKTKPVYTRIYPDPNTGYSMVLSGPLWELGRAGSGQHNIFADGIEDTSGIDSIKLIIKRADGTVVSDNALSYDVANKRAFFTWAIDARTGAGMPSSDLNEEFTFNFIVKDKAGNILTIPPQRFKYDDQIGEYTRFAVYDSRVNTSVVPGIASGYVAYKPGLVVLENPYRLVVRVPKSNWRPYRTGGITLINAYGGVNVISEDASYVYAELKLPQGLLDGNYVRVENTYEWGGGYLTGVESDLIWDAASLKSPAWGSPAIERQKSDGTWFNSVSWSNLKAKDMPVKLTNIRFNVQARPYAQNITGPVGCNIPAGSTSCTISLARDITVGTTGYLHDGYQIRSSSEATFMTPVWENVAWHTLGPTVTGYKYNDATNILEVYVNQPGDGFYFDTVRIVRVWLTDKSKANAEISVTGKQTGRNQASGNYTYVFNMKEIPEGVYDIQINAKDSFDNTASLAYENITVDNTPPMVNISYEDKSINKDMTVYGLENIRIKLSDALTKPSMTRMTLRGGPVSDSVELSWVKVGDNMYTPNYPRVFPSISDGETYTLTVTATDEMNNSKDESVEFNYLPNNLVRMENLKTLAVSSSLRTTDNTLLAVLYASQLRKKDGSIATGLQDGVLTVRKDAAFGVTINGVSALPGESKNITLDLGLGDSRNFPIYPAKSGKTGISEFMIDIPELK